MFFKTAVYSEDSFGELSEVFPVSNNVNLNKDQDYNGQSEVYSTNNNDS
jgi:hypothetical protein